MPMEPEALNKSRSDTQAYGPHVPWTPEHCEIARTTPGENSAAVPRPPMQRAGVRPVGAKAMGPPAHGRPTPDGPWENPGANPRGHSWEREYEGPFNDARILRHR